MGIGKILFVLNPFIHRDENLKVLLLGDGEEFAIFFTAKARLGRSKALVIGKLVFQLSRQALIQ